MAKVRILSALEGHGVSWRVGDVVEVSDDAAARMAERGVASIIAEAAVTSPGETRVTRGRNRKG